MPLVWNLENTEFAKNKKIKISSAFVCMVGMEVLNMKGDGYVPTLNDFELDKVTAEKIIKNLLKSKDPKFNDKEKQEIKELIPAMIGGKFRRRD